MSLDTFAELKSEFLARGFHYLEGEERVDDYINYAYLVDVCEADAWPFLEASTTGVAPVSVTDLRAIEAVIDTTNGVKLKPLDRRNVTDLTATPTETGSASYYYITGGNTVTTWPVGTGTLQVYYWKVPTALAADANEPLVPQRFRQVIVDFAEVRAYTDDDEPEQAANSLERAQARLEAMRTSLMLQQYDEPDQWLVARDFLSWET